jgi:hypothetical protein
VGVGHEIRRQEKSSGEFALTAEVTFGARIEAVEKGIVAVENIVAVVEEIHHEAAIRNGKVTRRLAAARVEMLIIGIERHRKHAARTPLKSVFFAVALPDAGRAVSFGDIHHFFVHVLLRLGLAAGGNLAHIGIIGAAGAVEHHHRTRHALQIPVFERKRIHVFDKESPNHRYLLFCLPVFVGVDALRF